MNIAYCEDEKIQKEILEELLCRWGKVDLVWYESAEQMLFECDGRYPFDLIILDIQMRNQNGMELARQIRRDDPQVPLLFLTATKEYVFEGYEVNALRYLIKPIQPSQLFAILGEIQASTKRSILLNGNRIDLNALVYVEAEAHYCHLVFEDHRQKEKIGIRELKTMLDDSFVMIHRSYLVNIAKVDQIRREELSAGSFTLPVARSQLKTVSEAFIEYNKGISL
ncbi:LytR/AlgR family response regulator transcription factor [Holdemania massiliensis]|uniref:Response regulator n=1 Tax=Holdemania massiliensis TaxID=1468449 RepID=A0A6N7S8A5_9FIRM|nr:LytTR family DNA-binding domain-containing protein [Holdemania massiliensis]MSA71823.1 response regulator [Holdemania massiliensis]MSA90097.1 response regulator [Holdemania massiliensis]MSB78903.1 response regulator [Holdemania massiliensis]MSC33827.1 response regulator [Holdemania massiliensis]MSC40217.1 response regulator [Holdemania massiliensis]